VAARIITWTPRAIVALTFIGDDRAKQQAAENAGCDARTVVAAAIMTVAAAIATTATAIVLAAATVVLLPVTALPLATA
jgi:hypothetical protein